MKKENRNSTRKFKYTSKTYEGKSNIRGNANGR